jgi:hypothetical protein
VEEKTGWHKINDTRLEQKLSHGPSKNLNNRENMRNFCSNHVKFVLRFTVVEKIRSKKYPIHWLQNFFTNKTEW